MYWHFNVRIFVQCLYVLCMFFVAAIVLYLHCIVVKSTCFLELEITS